MSTMEHRHPRSQHTLLMEFHCCPCTSRKFLHSLPPQHGYYLSTYFSCILSPVYKHLDCLSSALQKSWRRNLAKSLSEIRVVHIKRSLIANMFWQITSKNTQVIEAGFPLHNLILTFCKTSYLSVFTLSFFFLTISTSFSSMDIILTCPYLYGTSVGMLEFLESGATFTGYQSSAKQVVTHRC